MDKGKLLRLIPVFLQNMEETNSIATNEEPEQLKCVHCPSAKFVNVEDLKNHSRNRHRELKFFCDCGNAFTNQNSKEQHVNEHHSA